MYSRWYKIYRTDLGECAVKSYELAGFAGITHFSIDYSRYYKSIVNLCFSRAKFY